MGVEGARMTTKKTTKKKLPTMKDIWETLSKINVNEYLQKKGDFDYLPWGDAWAIMMEHYPDTTFENHLNDNGYPCFCDPQGRGMVRVTVTVCGHSHTEDYMVTNYSNKVIQDPDPSQVNNCLKRALVKCLAYFGLGSYLYNQLDMLESSATDEPVEFKPATHEQITIIKAEIAFSDNDKLEEQLVKWAGLKKGDNIEDISFEKATQLVEKYSAKA
jgi:hypothetical protein